MATDINYSGAKPWLVIADGPAASTRASAALAAAGSPMLASVGIDGAAAQLARLPRQILVEVDGATPNETLHELLGRIAAGASVGRHAAIVSTPAALIDTVAARIGDAPVQQLADASHADRVAALLSTPRANSGVRERGGEGADATRLRALTDEVGRIAGALARLSANTPAATATSEPTSDADRLDRAEIARIVRTRALRGRWFEPALFADPAWDMLLDLAAARIDAKPVAVSSLCIAAAVPPTTALRWIRMLTDAGLFVRRADPADGRRVFIDLSDAAAAAMRAYLGEIRPLV